MKKLCIICSIDIWRILRYSVHFCLALQKNRQPCKSIRQSIDNNEFGCWIYWLKKAFDTVNHGILLTKLNHHGVRGNVDEWFKSYLSNREELVIGSEHYFLGEMSLPPWFLMVRPLLFVCISPLVMQKPQATQYFFVFENYN